MYTKEITVETDWLHEIDGLTVEKAIAYLQTLDKSHVLNFYMDGDTEFTETNTQQENKMTSIMNLPATFSYECKDGMYILFHNNVYVTACNYFEDIVAAAYGILADEE